MCRLVRIYQVIGLFLMSGPEQQIRHSLQGILNQNKNSKLNRVNEQILLEKLLKNEKNKNHFCELVKKRDEYDQKLNRFLSSLIPEILVVKDLGSYVGPDPKTIVNRHHASKYLDAKLTDSLVWKIRELIQDQLLKQESWKKERLSIIDSYNQNIKAMTDSQNNSCGAMKLKLFKDNIHSNRLKEAEETHQQELLKFDQSVSFKVKNMIVESKSLLRDWNVPFFCLKKELKYPDLEKDRSFILEEIQSRIKKEQSNH